MDERYEKYNLQSPYSKKLYELILENKSAGTITLTLKDLRFHLGLLSSCSYDDICDNILPKIITELINLTCTTITKSGYEIHPLFTKVSVYKSNTDDPERVKFDFRYLFYDDLCKKAD